jgi:tRNA nucleotidyltransferase (CCA-adding enzyme)
MRVDLPKPVEHIIATLNNAGFTCEIVGGAVRDLLLGVPTNDWDFTTNARPEQILPLFTESFNENAFGTVMVAQKHLKEQFGFESAPSEDDLVYDITTYRSDGTYENYRHPQSVTWGDSIEEDLKRRDFTINAMALRANTRDKTSELIDPFGGQEDIGKHLIRAVGDPTVRFKEDALRMLRAIRFMAQLDMKLDSETSQAIHAHANLLSHISQERISDEFMKILASPKPEDGVRELDHHGLLPFILPELVDAKGVRQSGHHIYDVYEHSLKSLGACPSSDPIVRLATLVHDIAKPLTTKETEEGTVTFYNHEVIGARVAKSIAQRLRLSKKDCDRMFTLVRWHMFTYEKFATDAYVRRFIRRVGVENIDDIMDLRTADRIGSGSKPTSWRLEELKERIYEQLHQPLQINQMAIDGHDVMEHLHVQPGPIIGKVLNELFEDVLEHPEHNTREYLLEQLNRFK